ncbi:MAG: riboflavin synthase [Flavisolibacter sp.]
MFTGIIESKGQVREISVSGSNKTFWIESPLTSTFKIDQSLAHDGVCLTIEDIQDQLYRVTAVEETLKKTALSQWQIGTTVNLERSLMTNSRLDGHFVQGHVDTTGICIDIRDKEGSHEMEFEFPKKFASLLIEKGSICINGVSLTAFRVKKHSFRVAIIPYTWEHTNLGTIQIDQEVNLEFDMIGKYIQRKLSLEK